MAPAAAGLEEDAEAGEGAVALLYLGHVQVDDADIHLFNHSSITEDDLLWVQQSPFMQSTHRKVGGVVEP